MIHNHITDTFLVRQIFECQRNGICMKALFQSVCDKSDFRSDFVEYLTTKHWISIFLVDSVSGVAAQ